MPSYCLFSGESILIHHNSSFFLESDGIVFFLLIFVDGSLANPGWAVIVRKARHILLFFQWRQGWVRLFCSYSFFSEKNIWCFCSWLQLFFDEMGHPQEKKRNLFGVISLLCWVNSVSCSFQGCTISVCSYTLGRLGGKSTMIPFVESMRNIAEW